VNFDTLFSYLVKLTGWGLGVYVILAGKIAGTELVALIIAFVGFELVTRARERKLPELVKQREARNGE
jgi:hypothetical protein